MLVTNRVIKKRLIKTIIRKRVNINRNKFYKKKVIKMALNNSNKNPVRL